MVVDSDLDTDREVNDDDLRLLVEASTRLTLEHPDLGDRLIRLKVRLQKKMNAPPRSIGR